MAIDRVLPVALAAAVVLLWQLLPFGGGALGLFLAVLCTALALSLMGLGLLRVLGWRGPENAVWPASLVVGTAAATVLASLPLVFGLGAKAQSMALVVGLMGLGAAAVLSPAIEGDGRARRLLAIVPMVGIVAAWFPLLVGNAWTVAGHDFDTLQHQDGALHAMMAELVAEGLRPAPGYPLGLHALLSALSSTLGVHVFHTFAVLMVLLVGVAAAAAVWSASSCGGSPIVAALAGVMVGVHPLLLFTGMEQFGPQLAAAALVPGALAASLDETAHDHPFARAALPALMLAAILSAYGLALAVAGPMVILSVALRRPFPSALKRLGFVLLLAALLAPLGVFRTVERLTGKGDGASPVKAARRVKDAVPDPAQLLSPDVVNLGEHKEARSALRWEMTAAHVVGASPYRDHFLRTARLVQTQLGSSIADALRVPMWLWAGAAVPLATLLLLILAVMGIARRVRAAPVADVIALAWVLPATLGAVWLGAGSGIKPYYGFKMGSLTVGLLMVAVALGLDALGERQHGRWKLALLLGLLLTRAPALMAVEMEYGRELALDRAFVQMMAPTMVASRNRAAYASDGSPTRRYWESRLLLGRANEVADAYSADVLLCARGRECPLEGVGRLVARSGGYSLWARRGD